MLIGSLSLMLVSCKTGTMSVQEAQDVAVEFKGAHKTNPPRGLGTTIQRKVHYYKDPPNVPAEYQVPQKTYSDDELRARFKALVGSDRQRVLRWTAYREFLSGNIRLALRINEMSIKAAEWDASKSKSYANKAIFFANVGDYISAEKAISLSDAGFRKWKSTTRRSLSDPSYIHNLFTTARGRAAIYFAQGDLIAAEKEYNRAIYLLKEFNQKTPGYRVERIWLDPELRMNLARVLMGQGRLTEAEVAIRDAIGFDQIEVLPHCFVVLSKILFEQGRFEDASECARTALHMAMAVRSPLDSLVRAECREMYALTLVANHRFKKALEQYDLIEKELKTDPDTFYLRFKGSTEWGLALLMSGNAAGAIEKFEFALSQMQDQSNKDPYHLAELGALRAMALSQVDKTMEALEEFNKHIPKLLNNWQAEEGARSNQNARAFKFKLLLDANIALLAEVRNSNHAEKSFYLSNALQDKILGKAVALSSARAEVSDPELASLIRQQQDLEMKLAALKNRLADIFYTPPEFINKLVVEDLQEKVTALNLAASTLRQEVKNRFPEYAEIINPNHIDVATVRSTLDPNEALISIFSGRQNTYIWAIPKDGQVAFVQVPISKEKMAEIVGELRESLSPGDAQTVMEIPPYDINLAYDLYKMVLKPVESGWNQARNLLVVTQGPIGQIPLAILPTEKYSQDSKDTQKPYFSNYRDVEWLIKKHSITVLPSTTAFINLRSISGKAKAVDHFVGFGDPYFSLEQLEQAESKAGQLNASLTTRSGPIQVRGIRVTEAGALDKKKITSINIGMLNRLPDTRAEVISIAATLKADIEKDVFIGKQACEQVVKNMDLSDRKVVVFATHGLVPGDLDGLNQPALALSAPDVADDAENDGLLTMGEIMGLRLNADWVVLSACNTGAAEGEGAEAISGLGQAFFYAGARSLLVTGWPVETISAKLLTTDLFQRQLENPDINRAEALQITMNAMIAKDHKDGFSYAHPIFWAPFAIVGDGRR